MPGPSRWLCVTGMSRILLVEDDAELRLLLEHVLLGAAYAVDTAAGVREAFALLDSHAYDLVLADGRLGDGTGMAVAERALQSGAEPGLIHLNLAKVHLTRKDHAAARASLQRVLQHQPENAEAGKLLEQLRQKP